MLKDRYIKRTPEGKFVRHNRHSSKRRRVGKGKQKSDVKPICTVAITLDSALPTERSGQGSSTRRSRTMHQIPQTAKKEKKRGKYTYVRGFN